MKFILPFAIIPLLLGVTDNCYSQSTGKIVYEAVLEAEDYDTLNAVLLFQNKSSFFFIENEDGYESENLKNEENLLLSEANELNIKIKPPENAIIHAVNIDREQNLIRSKKTIYKSGQYVPSIVVEPSGTIKWELINESKKIGSYQAFKAISTFRGRNYVAWYAPEIEVNAGPWKFQGLPGLILEIMDEDQGVQFKLSSVTIPYEFSQDSLIFEEELVLNIEEYASLNDPKIIIEEFVEWLESSISQSGAVIKSTNMSTTINRNGIEREYK
ncbi:MAG TPA: GLPGLI family protein [Anaerovoracaceae bacterium]|nr:GLPGLI family protein [Anaerovoracaceae bacterium]